jgi:hypothetical protein
MNKAWAINGISTVTIHILLLNLGEIFELTEKINNVKLTGAMNKTDHNSVPYAISFNLLSCVFY